MMNIITHDEHDEHDEHYNTVYGQISIEPKSWSDK